MNRILTFVIYFIKLSQSIYFFMYLLYPIFPPLHNILLFHNVCVIVSLYHHKMPVILSVNSHKYVINIISVFYKKLEFCDL